MSLDKLCYMSVFGHKSVYESRVPASVRGDFQSYIAGVHKDALQNFGEQWKTWLKENPRAHESDDEDKLAASVAAVAGGKLFNIGTPPDTPATPEEDGDA